MRVVRVRVRVRVSGTRCNDTVLAIRAETKWESRDTRMALLDYNLCPSSFRVCRVCLQLHDARGPLLV